MSGNGRWRVSVDRSACLGSGSCIGIAPRHFKFVDHRSTPFQELVEPDDSVRAAVDVCPAEAITVADAVTGEPLR